MQAVEHILLESDERTLPQRHTARRIHTSHRFRSRLRRRVVELDIIDYYYLFCRAKNARSGGTECMLDLRFVDPALGQYRHMPLRWFAVAGGCAALTILVWAMPASEHDWEHIRLIIGGLLLFMWIFTGIVSIYRLTETLEVRSMHGQATLLEVTGGLGTLRSLRPFTRRLAAHLRIAAEARRRSKAEHLRDEMREHHRLREAGVLSNRQYEESKRRILAHHPPA